MRAGKTFRRPTLRPAKDPRLDDVGIVGARVLSPAVAAAIQKAQALVPRPERRRRASTAGEGEMQVLGIDAAWTLGQPSGVALIAKSTGVWRLLAAAPSYEIYRSRSDGSSAPDLRARGGPADAEHLLLTSHALAGASVDLVAIDMPLARTAITTRRLADNAVSRAYGARKCSTHTPSAERPGPLGEALQRSFEVAGFELCTSEIRPPGLMEVYPHPALVELGAAPERLPYKLSKARAYWPALSPPARRERLIEMWGSIVDLLDHEIDGVAAMLALPDLSAPGWQLKAFEDTLDAVVCAWVGACALEGKCTPYGDLVAAIWIPEPAVTLQTAASSDRSMSAVFAHRITLFHHVRHR